jgi:hypothetical protein
MHVKDSVEIDEVVVPDASHGAELLLPLMVGQPAKSALAESHSGVVVGELIAITDDGRTPLVAYPGQTGSAAVGARAVIDLHGAHIGRRVVLMFDGGDHARPIVMGVIREGVGCPLEEKPGTVEVDADGERLVVIAKERLVLRCGKASITLTKAGKVLIEGSYVSSRSTGVNRVKGGSVQLN